VHVLLRLFPNHWRTGGLSDVQCKSMGVPLSEGLQENLAQDGSPMQRR
jgi:hypothetical protein